MQTIDKVRKFHKAFNLSHGRAAKTPTLDDDERDTIKGFARGLAAMADSLHVQARIHRSMTLLRLQLIIEEVAEVADVMEKFGEKEGSIYRLAHELADLQYVVDGALLDYGLDRCKGKVFDKIWRANMSKLGADGRPILSPGGRVQKGPNFHKADVTSAVQPHEPCVIAPSRVEKLETVDK